MSSNPVYIVDAISGSGTLTVECNDVLFCCQAITATGSIAVAVNEFSRIFDLVVVVIQDATGSRTVSWSSDFIFEGGTAPTASTEAGSKDVYRFTRFDGKLGLISFSKDVK